MERVRVRGNTIPGGHAGGVTPVPISNTEVKSSRADDTAAVRQWESRTLPGLKQRPAGLRISGPFYFLVGAGFIPPSLLDRRRVLSPNSPEVLGTPPGVGTPPTLRLGARPAPPAPFLRVREAGPTIIVYRLYSQLRCTTGYG